VPINKLKKQSKEVESHPFAVHCANVNLKSTKLWIK